jgi:hypothetical protein
MVRIPPAPPVIAMWGKLTEFVRQVPVRHPMDPPAAWVAAAEGAGGAGLVAVPPGEVLDELEGLLAELDDPPHAASSAIIVTAPAAQLAAVRSWLPV